VVPVVLVTAFLVTLDPHATALTARIARRPIDPSMARHARLRGTQNSNTQARTAPPNAILRRPGKAGRASIALPAAMVVTVRVAVAALEPVICTALVDPKLSVGMSCEPAGLAVMLPESATAPVNPPLGVTVMVDAFPVTAPAVTVTAAPLMAKTPESGLMV
jgi:hypothetical protein